MHTRHQQGTTYDATPFWLCANPLHQNCAHVNVLALLQTKGMREDTWILLGEQAHELADALKTQPMHIIWEQTTLGSALQQLVSRCSENA